jgi:replicative DNA helicase
MSAVGCLEAERAVLGCLLSLPLRPARDVAWTLQLEDFTDPRHRAVFAAISDCMLADVAADPVTVLGEMRRAGTESCMTDDRSAGTFLADLLAAAPVVASAGHYARVVVEHRARRRLVEAGERLRQVAERSPLDTVRDVALEEWTALSLAFNRLDPATPRRLAPGPVQVVA